jgi:hypothetical protein
MACDPGLVYDVLTDYESYAEWLPMVVQSKTLAREGDLAIAEFELATPQKDKFDFECIHTRNKMVLWRTLGGRLPIAQVEWSINGAGNSCEVTLAVTGKIHLGLFLPGATRFLKPKQCTKALQSQLSTFMPESGTPELAIRNEAGERILELAETEDGVICWIRGKKYALQPTQEGTHSGGIG